MSKSVKKLQEVHLSRATSLKLTVWRIRRFVQDIVGADVLDTTHPTPRHLRTKVRQVYITVDDFLVKIVPGLMKLTPPSVALKRIRRVLETDLEYSLVDMDEAKPWGAYYRIDDLQADRFLQEFFPNLSLSEAKLGRTDVALSPKILVVYPGQSLSWQYHDRRAERWRFLTTGGYYRSHSDTQGRLIRVNAGDVIQFDTGERHRLQAAPDDYTIVAEIWQHTLPGKPSDESDIVRLHDHYKR